MKRFVPEIIAIACAALLMAFCATSCANRQAKTDNTPLPELPPIPEVPEKLPIASVTMDPPDSFPEVKLDIPITPGPFQPTWESIEENYPGTPQWLRDAKVGIWVHFGPQASGESGDWDARRLY